MSDLVYNGCEEGLPGERRPRRELQLEVRRFRLTATCNQSKAEAWVAGSEGSMFVDSFLASLPSYPPQHATICSVCKKFGRQAPVVHDMMKEGTSVDRVDGPQGVQSPTRGCRILRVGFNAVVSLRPCSCPGILPEQSPRECFRVLS